MKIPSFDGKADLIALSGDLTGRRFLLEDYTVLGRDPAAAIRVSGEDVSRKHAAITITSAGEFVVEDLKSRNGTFVNGAPVEVHVLKFGDKLQVGARHLFVFTPHSAPEEQLIRWQRLELVAQLSAGAMHDFANCMTAVLANIEYLQQLIAQGQCDIPTIREHLIEMNAAAQQGARLSRKVLGFVRDTEARTAQIDITSLIENSVRLISHNLGPAVKVDLRVDPGLSVSGDRTELLQVLINLFLNARDAMRGGGTLTVRAHLDTVNAERARYLRLAKPGECVALRVTDNGVGIDQATLSRIFEPLFTTKAPGSGTGLGLSTVATIVENHGGVVDVESAPGRGTTFTVYLPAGEHEDGEPGWDSRATIAPKGSRSSRLDP